MAEPFNKIHPGEILREEFMAPVGLSAEEMAIALKLSLEEINRLLACEVSVTENIANRLASFFNTDPDFWLNLQHEYDNRQRGQQSAKIRTPLMVTAAVAGFVQACGAVRENGAWYYYGAFDGDVPPELEEFVSKAPRQRGIEDHLSEMGPSCPVCNAHMEKKLNRKTGDYFWGCSRFPHCKCTKELSYAGTKRASNYLVQDSPVNKTGAVSGKRVLSIPDEVQEEAKRITALAVQLHGSVTTAKRWLETPKIALGRKTPLEVMSTLKGCADCARLLNETFT